MKGYMQEWYLYAEGSLNNAVERAMDSLNKERREYIDMIPFEVDNKLLLIYKEGTEKANAPLEDIQRFAPAPQNPVPAEHYFQQPSFAPEEDDSLLGTAKRYWVVIVIVLAFAAYTFFWG